MSSAKILTRTAKTGYLVGSTTRAVCTALNITALSVNGLGVVNGFVELAKQDKNEVTKLEILQLTTSIFFLYSFIS